MSKIKEGLKTDPHAQSIIALIREGKTRRFWLDEDILYTKVRRIYVPKWGNLRRELVKEYHDSLWAGHPGIRHTFALLKSTYYWPRMRDEVKEYVRTCLVCQQDKVVQQQPGGLLNPLPMGKRLYGFHHLSTEVRRVWEHHSRGGSIQQVCNLHGRISRLHCGGNSEAIPTQRS